MNTFIKFPSCHRLFKKWRHICLSQVGGITDGPINPDRIGGILPYRGSFHPRMTTPNLKINGLRTVRYVQQSIMLLVSLCAMPAAHCASFDCARPDINAAERLVCSDRRVSDLDIQLSYAYSLLIDVSDQHQRSKARIDQQRWLVGVRNKCHTAECLDKAYTKRISAVQDQASRNLANNKPLLESIYSGSPNELDLKRSALQDCQKGALTLLFCTMAKLAVENHVLDALLKEKSSNLPLCKEQLKQRQIGWKKRRQQQCEEYGGHVDAGSVGTGASIDFNDCVLRETVSRVVLLKHIHTCSDVSTLDSNTIP